MQTLYYYYYSQEMHCYSDSYLLQLASLPLLHHHYDHFLLASRVWVAALMVHKRQEQRGKLGEEHRDVPAYRDGDKPVQEDFRMAVEDNRHEDDDDVLEAAESGDAEQWHWEECLLLEEQVLLP